MVLITRSDRILFHIVTQIIKYLFLKLSCFQYLLRSAPLLFPFRNPLCLPCRTAFSLSTTSAALTHLLALHSSSLIRLENAHCLPIAFCKCLFFVTTVPCPNSLFTKFEWEKQNKTVCLEWACKSFLKHIFLS